MFFRLRRRESHTTRHGGSEIHRAPGHSHVEVDTAPAVFRTTKFHLQHIRRLRSRHHTRGPRPDREDDVGIYRPGNVSLRPESVPERRGMRATGFRRFPVPLPHHAQWYRLFQPGGSQR